MVKGIAIAALSDDKETIRCLGRKGEPYHS
jgi:hypothetical protein